MLNKKARISIWFVIILIASFGIWYMFKDIATAALIFFGYIFIRIAGNFLKGRKQMRQDGY